MPTEEDKIPGEEIVSDVVPPLTPRTFAVVSVCPARIVIVVGVTIEIAGSAVLSDNTWSIVSALDKRMKNVRSMLSIGTANGAGLMMIVGVAGLTVKPNNAVPADETTVKFAAPSGAIDDAFSVKVIWVAVICKPLSDNSVLGELTVTPNKLLPVTVMDFVSPRLMLFGETRLTTGPGTAAVKRFTSRILPTAS